MKPSLLLMGQLPPPWHGQAVASKVLFDHDWSDFEVLRLPMEYSKQMDQVGRFSLRKIFHVFELILKARNFLKKQSDCTLLYPPASANWLPFLRDVAFLCAIRSLCHRRVFIYHASGLAEWCDNSKIRLWLARKAYGNADHSLEVSEESIAPHHVFQGKSSSWCPCGIDIPPDTLRQRKPDGKTRVLFVGSLQEGKGILDILKTAACLKQQGRECDFEFQIVGNWFSQSFCDQALALMNELEVNTMVKFVGARSGKDKWQSYADADVFFFPTHYTTEATPIVLMEAMGMGLPIVTTNWRGIPRMLDDCPSTIMLETNDIKGFAKALDDILPANKQGLISHYQKHFTENKFIERVEKVIYTI